MSAQQRTSTGGGTIRLGGYRTIKGAPDELLDSSGAIRPVWQQFADHFGRMSPAEIAQRFDRGDQYLRDAGVYFRQYESDGSAERAWPLSHVPVLLAEEEWRQIGEGLKERADLLEAVVADLYGPGQLIADGHLPASLIASSREWLRPLVGVKPQTGHFLHFLAFDIGRGPDGKWWVLGDRTQAPSGVGFALENRVATSRVFSDLYADAKVHRLAGFFRTFRDALTELRGDGDSRVGILTPGLLNDTYFEHAYIARYLGFMLLEGEDLTVQNGNVMVRTVEGLRPVSVLWRRLDSTYADPLELDETSRLGTPGLTEAVRRGNVSLINALGTGVLETRALLAFMPRISEALNGKKLAMPNIATWWCGQPAEREHVLANADKMVIGPALSTRPLFETEHMVEQVEDALEDEGAFLVGQEAVRLSTTPAYVDGQLVSRPLSLRLFLARTPKGWEVMPGGYARIGLSSDTSAIGLQRGGLVADVWVVSNAPVETETMLSVRKGPYQRVPQGALPSRAADNLFWMGRYVERAEETIRLLRAYHTRLLETAAPDAPLVMHLATYLEGLGIDPSESFPQGLLHALAGAIGSASRVRDRFSVDGWMALNELAETARDMRSAVTPGDDAARAMSVLLRKINGFSGLVHENMYRFNGWRFLSIGRALERTLAMGSILARFADPEAPDGALDLAVEVGDSVMSHRRRYSVATNRNTVIDLLALDDLNPRSMLYQLSVTRELVEDLPRANINGQMSPLSRAVLKALTALAVQTPDTLDTEALQESCAEVAKLSELITATYFN